MKIINITKIKQKDFKKKTPKKAKKSNNFKVRISNLKRKF